MTTRPKQYNLRSARLASVQISVKLQLQKEDVMSTEATSSTDTTHQCLVSFDDAGESSINLDELINTGDSDVESDSSTRKCHKFQFSSVVDAGKVE